MTNLGCYQVPIQTLDAGQQLALLAPARAEDMPKNWTFDWPGLWQRTDFECQNIFKLIYLEQVWGLVRYGIYPFPGTPTFLEIEHLETNPLSRGQQAARQIEPVGKWLMWYAVQVGLQYWSRGASGEFSILLVSLEDAFDYYRIIIQMQYIGPTNIAPGEDGYVFSFSRTGAAAFCLKLESECGVPTPIDS